MKKLLLLDCTLRDGGRLINCEFGDNIIEKVITDLTSANIEIVEVGFLRDGKKLIYKQGSTFFTSVEQIKPYIRNKTGNTEYVAFVDFGMFDFDTLAENDGTVLDGIRVGFTKDDYLNRMSDVKKAFHAVKAKGYKLFVQGVNTLGFTDAMLIDICNLMNEINPYSFGIVDTYGAMYLEDVSRIFSLVDHNLDANIAIDLHAHNNRQMAFALAQEVIRYNNGRRQLIIDATLEGMGKSAGNLNLELMVDLLTKKFKSNYNFDKVLDTIDVCLYEIKEDQKWGYSIPALMGGIYNTHPNNIIYLTEKYRLTNKDIKNIVSMIDDTKKHHYDYANIEKLYLEYNNSIVEDSKALETITKLVEDKKILICAPGRSIVDYKARIDKFIKDNNPLIISVNYIGDYDGAYIFFANKKRYEQTEGITEMEHVIATSNVVMNSKNLIINYHSLIDRRYKLFDNSTIMLLNLLKIVGAKEIYLAGVDGYSNKIENNYFNSTYGCDRYREKFNEINTEIEQILNDYISSTAKNMTVRFLTPTRYKIKMSDYDD